jgi:hypothetical protein
LATMEQRKVPEPWKEGNDKQPDVLDWERTKQPFAVGHWPGTNSGPGIHGVYPSCPLVGHEQSPGVPILGKVTLCPWQSETDTRPLYNCVWVQQHTRPLENHENDRPPSPTTVAAGSSPVATLVLLHLSCLLD